MNEEEKERLSFEKTKELYAFLCGKAKKFDGITTCEKLTPNQAFSIIYILQEADSFGCIPDIFEKCDECNELFNIEEGGDNTEAMIELMLCNIVENNELKVSDELYKKIQNEIEKNIEFKKICDCSISKYVSDINQEIHNQLKNHNIDISENDI